MCYTPGPFQAYTRLKDDAALANYRLTNTILHQIYRNVGQVSSAPEHLNTQSFDNLSVQQDKLEEEVDAILSNLMSLHVRDNILLGNVANVSAAIDTLDIKLVALWHWGFGILSPGYRHTRGM